MTSTTDRDMFPGSNGAPYFMAAVLYRLRRMECERWLRVLMVVFPLLGSIAMLSYATVQTRQFYREVREIRHPKGSAAGLKRNLNAGPLQAIQQLDAILKREEGKRQQRLQQE